MKKVLILAILVLFTGCATAPKIQVKPQVHVIPEAFVVKAEQGYIECLMPGTEEVSAFPFRGDVILFRDWIIFQPHEKSNTKKTVVKFLCQIFVLDKLSYTKSENVKKGHTL